MPELLHDPGILAEQRILSGAHVPAFSRAPMIEPDQMERAVDHEPRQLGAGGDPKALRLGVHAIERDHEIAVHRWRAHLPG
jgi:hypothetical protein